jgi:nucleoside-diphosphate-sugar epimerase
MTTAVTGSAGFIGSHLAQRLLDAGEQVVGIDCYTDYYDESIKRARTAQLREHPGFRFVEVDIVDGAIADVIARASRVYHLAAQPGVRGSWGDTFDVYVRQNVLGTQRVLEAVRGTNTRIVVASSSSVYGDAEGYPTSEDVVPRPRSPYGVTKLATEQLAMTYHRSFGVDVRAIRYFTVYGPGQRPDMAFTRFIDAALHDRPVEVYGDGHQIRDFTFVADAVDATILAGTVDAIDGTILNVGGGSQTTVLEVLDVIGRTLGTTVPIRFLPAQPGDVLRTGADLTRIQSTLGWRPSVGINEGLAAQVRAAKGDGPAS